MTGQPPVIIEYSVDDVEAILELRRKFISDAWGAASAYEAAITVAGYGAFFGLWSAVADDVTKVARNATAAMMGSSLILYVGWVISVMIMRHLHDRKFIAEVSKARSPSDALLAWDAIDIERRDSLIKFQHRFWMPVFGSSFALGVLGAGTLVYNCAAIATGLPQLTGQF